MPFGSAPFISPLTTKGDIFGFSTAKARIPIGTDNQVLTADSTQALGVKWAVANTSSTASKSANYTLTSSDQVILADTSAGSFTITFPTAVGVTGRLYTIIKTAQINTLTLSPTGAETLAGNATISVTMKNASLTFISNGSNWVLFNPSALYLTNPSGTMFAGTMNTNNQLVLTSLAGVTTYLSDTFTAANGTNINARTPDIGAAWAALAGTWSIQSNQATKSATNATHEAIVSDCAAADVKNTADITTGAANNYSLLCIRMTDMNNGWMTQAQAAGGVNVNIFERNAGTFTSRASGSQTINANTTYSTYLQGVGNTISAKWGTNTELSYTSATFNNTATKHGMWHYNTDQQTDNIIVTSA